MADRTFVEWDKDDLDALGMLKIDVLALGMLSAIRRVLTLLPPITAKILNWRPCLPKTAMFTTCCAVPRQSGCFRWKAARR